MKSLALANMVPLFLEALCVVLLLLGFLPSIPFWWTFVLAGLIVGVFLLEQWLMTIPSFLHFSNRIAFYTLFAIILVHSILELFFPAQSSWWNWWVLIMLFVLLLLKGFFFSTNESIGIIQKASKNQVLVQYFFDPKSGLVGGIVQLPLQKGMKGMVGKKVRIHVGKGLVANKPLSLL